MKSPHPNPAPLPAADFTRTLDAALSAEHDGILPSSGFADSVMTAVAREAAAPAPLPFPWKRALPGVAAALIVGALLLAILIEGLHALLTAPVAPASAAAAQFAGLLAPLLRHSAQSLWILGALAIATLSLVLCRRLTASH